MTRNRRTILKLAGATAAASIGSMAGCLSTVGLGDDESGSTPAYARWIASDEANDGTFYAYVDWATLETFDEFDSLPDSNEDGGTGWDDGDSVEYDDPDGGNNDSFENGDPVEDGAPIEHDDPMLATPMISILLVSISGGFSLIGTGLSGLISNGEFGGAETADFETEIDELLIVDDAFVLVGDVDTDEIHDTLTESPENEWGLKTEYEQTETIGDFDIYEPVDDDSIATEPGQTDAIAVSGDAIVHASGDGETDAIDVLRVPIEARGGDRERASDSTAEFEWLLETAGNGHIAFGGYGDFDDTDDEMDADPDAVDDLESLDDATGIVSSLTINGETNWNGEFAAVFDEIDDETKAKLEETLGSSADTVTHDIGDDRVSVSATWNEDPTTE